MNEARLYKRIAASIRNEILSGQLKPGDRLPSVREMATRWNCTAGTIQRAYGDLAQQGLVTGRAGQGTRVAEQPRLQGDTALRRASLTHRAEAFLLEVLTAGYTVPEVERAVQQALDRWRAVKKEPVEIVENTLRFAGSHDLVVAWLASQLAEVAPGCILQVSFSGSLGGLIALVEGKADLAGSHLWDAESDSYNAPFIRRLFPGRRIALVTLAHRRIGLMLPEGNPRGIEGLADLCQPGLTFINRQEGSGTRVWLDAALRRVGIGPERIQGYTQVKMTHSAVAQAVAEGQAQAGIGLEAAALNFGLHFHFLTRERYDLVVPETVFGWPAVQSLISKLAEAKTKDFISNLGGYEIAETGQIIWIE